MKKIALFGSTGSVGVQVLNVVRRLAGEVKVTALCAGKNSKKLQEQAEEFRPAFCGLTEGSREDGFTFAGPDACVRTAAEADYDLAVVAISGRTALPVVMAVLERGKDLALASKEVLAMAGELVTAKAEEKGVRILPLDSEHSAVFQCLQGGKREELEGIVLTASGGPFRTLPPEQLEKVTPEMALRHPTWKMGPKITVDSASLFNKGLEIIEARWLFGLEPKQIEVVVHPESVVHSLVRWRDGSLLAQLGSPTMEVPIAYALTWPDRLPARPPRLDLAALGRLTFEAPDEARFPCLRICREALEGGGAGPLAVNAADEVLVEAFLEGRIKWSAIPYLMERVLDRFPALSPRDLREVLAADELARRLTGEELAGHAPGRK